MKATTITIPSWAIEENAGIYGLATALALTNNEEKWVKIRAADQRKLFGYVPFGKRSIGLFDGQLQTMETVCFGTDCNWRPVYAAEFDNGRKPIITPSGAFPYTI